MGQRTLTELVREVLAKMAELDYKETTIVNYKRFYRHVTEFAEENGVLYYSEEFGSDFLAWHYNCHIDTLRDKCPNKRLRRPGSTTCVNDPALLCKVIESVKRLRVLFLAHDFA